MKLMTRLTVAMVVLVLLTATVVGLLTYRNVAALVLPRALDRIDKQASVEAIMLEVSARGARADVSGFRAAVAVMDIMMARLSVGIDPNAGANEAERRRRLALRFVAELTAKVNYRAFRVIGVDDGGRELVRVDRSGPDGAIRVVPDSELQRIGEQDSFKETIKLPDGQVYVSPIDLNRENGVIETPYVPVLHVATPIYTPEGRPFGIVIIGVDMRKAFASLRSAGSERGQLYVVNERGDYLVHPDSSREFGFIFGKPVRLQEDFPEFSEILTLDETVPRLIQDRAGARFGMGWKTVRLAGGPRVTVINTMPYSQLMAASIAVRDSSLLGGSAAVLGALALAVLLARSLTRPLVQMTKAVEGFGRNQSIAVPTNGSGEIRVLANAFARMAAEAREKTAALKQEIEERRGIVDTALDAFVQMDEGGKVIDWNLQAEAIFGWSRDEAIGKALGNLIVPERYRPRHRQGLAHFLRSGESSILGKRLEIEALRQDGMEIKVELSVTAMRRGSGYVFNASIRDITDRIAAEEQLRQAQKMEAVGQLTGGVAHDFNNILTIILGNLDILSEALASDARLLRILQMIDQAAERGAELTQRLLAFARKQPLQPRKVDLNALVVNIEQLLRHVLGEQIEIISALERDLWPAMVDRSQLETAILNLAVNARDAMPEGGKLTIETANVVLDRDYADSHSEVRPGNHVMIAITDTGSGIPEGIRDKVFEPFFTTKQLGKGTGLGLSMVYGFVKQSGGHIKVYSEVGHGTSVKIYLPRADAAEARLGEDVPLVPEIMGSETVLLVEDDPLVRDNAARQLASLGYQVVQAGDGRAGLAVLRERDDIDLLFTDVILPVGMSGRVLAEEACKIRPDIKVLFTSGYTENAIVHHGRLDHGVLLLAKPYRKAELARMVRLALANSGSGLAVPA